MEKTQEIGGVFLPSDMSCHSIKQSGVFIRGGGVNLDNKIDELRESGLDVILYRDHLEIGRVTCDHEYNNVFPCIPKITVHRYFTNN